MDNLKIGTKHIYTEFQNIISMIIMGGGGGVKTTFFLVY